VATGKAPRIVILASGSGTTAEYVVHATETGVLAARVALVVSNNPNAGVFERVRRLNAQYGLDIQTAHISSRTHPGDAGQLGEQTLEESEAIAQLCNLQGASAGLVLLAGYMKKLRGSLLELPVVNTHPGPLPETAGYHGVHVQERVLELGLAHSAQTLHWVDGTYDTGPIIAANPVPVMADDTPESLFDAVQVTEKSHLPVDLNVLLHG